MRKVEHLTDVVLVLRRPYTVNVKNFAVEIFSLYIFAGTITPRKYSPRNVPMF